MASNQHWRASSLHIDLLALNNHVCHQSPIDPVVTAYTFRIIMLIHEPTQNNLVRFSKAHYATVG